MEYVWRVKLKLESRFFSPLQDWDIQIFLSFSGWQFAARSFENPNKPLKDWNDAIMKVVPPTFSLRLVSRQAGTQFPALWPRERDFFRGPEVSWKNFGCLETVRALTNCDATFCRNSELMDARESLSWSLEWESERLRENERVREWERRSFEVRLVGRLSGGVFVS